MEDDQKLSIQIWKDLLKHCLDPQKVMDGLPNYFPINSSAKSKVDAKNSMHDKVVVVLDELMNMQGSFNPLIEAIQREHDWLPPLITGKFELDDVELQYSKVEYLKYISHFLSTLLPSIKDAFEAKEIAHFLKLKGFLTQEDEERVEARVTNSGNTVGVRLLLSILARKSPGWQRALKQKLKDDNLDADLIDILEDLPDDLNDFHEMSNSSSEVVAEDSKAASCNWKSSSSESNDVFDDQRENHTGICRTYSSSTKVTTEDLKAAASPWEENMFEKLGSSLEKNDVGLFKTGYEALNRTVGLHELHGSVYTVQHLSVLTSNKIIPKEAGFRTRNGPVHGEESLSPQHARISQKPIHGENVIICAPESTDCLQMIVHIIQSRFPHILDSVDRKIAIIVCNMTTKHNILRTSFASRQWKVSYCGMDDVIFLRRTLESHQVVVITAEALLSWLSLGSDAGKITEFDILVMDECDKAYSDGPHKDILRQYHAEKQARHTQSFPQIIGLLPSIGKSMAKSEALDYLKDLCAILDARGGIQTERSQKTSKSGSKKANVKVICDPFTLCLCEAIDEIVEVLYIREVRNLDDLRRPIKKVKGSADYIQWCKDLYIKAALLDDSSLRNYFLKCASLLLALNRAVFIKIKCTAEYALEILQREEIHANESARVAERRITGIFMKAKETLRSCINDTRVINLTLSDLQKELGTHFKKNKSSKVLFLVGDVELIEPMKAWLSFVKISNGLNFDIKRLEDNTSFSHPVNRKIIADFKTGGCKILISMVDAYPKYNSVPCNLIICYDCTIEKAKHKAASKLPKVLTFSPTVVAADDKVKVEKSLLMEVITNAVEKTREENEAEFFGDLEKRQNKIFNYSQPNFHRHSRGTRKCR